LLGQKFIVVDQIIESLGDRGQSLLDFLSLALKHLLSDLLEVF
jgi:hypothetical protein